MTQITPKIGWSLKKKKKTLRSNTDWVCLCFASILDVEQVVANLLTGTIYRFG